MVQLEIAAVQHYEKSVGLIHSRLRSKVLMIPSYFLLKALLLIWPSLPFSGLDNARYITNLIFLLGE